MKVLLTGAGGFLGSATAEALVQQGHTVRALLRGNADARTAAPGAGVETRRGDLRVDDLDALLEGVDAVVHLAAAFSGDVMEQFQKTVLPTERLLDAMLRVGTRRLVLVSTFSVYDWNAAGQALTEQWPLDRRLERRDGYAITKTWQESLCRRYAEKHGLRLTVLRPGFIWSDERAWVEGIGIRAGSSVIVYGPCRRLPLTHVTSCAECIALCVGAEAVHGETLNVVDSDEVRAWRHAGDLIRSRKISARRRIPLPYHLGLWLAIAIRALARPWLGPEMRLPGILLPERYRARFRSLRFPNQKARSLLGWNPREHKLRDDSGQR